MYETLQLPVCPCGQTAAFGLDQQGRPAPLTGLCDGCLYARVYDQTLLAATVQVMTGTKLQEAE